MKKQIKKVSNIIEGGVTRVLNETGLLNPEDSEIIEKRLSICNECPFNSEHVNEFPNFTSFMLEAQLDNAESLALIENLTKLTYTNVLFDENGLNLKHCVLCGCHIKTKVSCLSCNCGIDEYNKKYNKSKPLMWTAKQTKQKDDNN